MSSILRSIHVLAVALWFGSVVFFSVAGVLIFNAFHEVSALTADQRPSWLPIPPGFNQTDGYEGFPKPLRSEQGSRAAGVAVSKIFPVYYLMQTLCGILVVLTTWYLRRTTELSGPSWRTALALIALLSVLGGWWLEMRVAELRVPRNELSDRVILSEAPSVELLESAGHARQVFGQWHGYSLVQNFLTLGLVTLLTLTLPLRPLKQPGG